MTTYLSDYANFKTKEEMDKASSQHVSANWNQLNSTDRSVLDMIRRYSVKYGAAHLKHETIANTIKKSVSTVKAVIAKLIKLGIIEKVRFIRKVLSGMGANIYSILPFKSENYLPETVEREVAENSTVSTHEATKTENEPSLYKSSKDINYINTYPEAPQSFYSHFRQRVVSMIGEVDQSLISKLFGIYKAQSIKMLRFSIYEDKISQFEALAMQSLSITLQATKKKPIKSITGFFSGTYSNLIERNIIGVSDHR